MISAEQSAGRPPALEHVLEESPDEQISAAAHEPGKIHQSALELDLLIEFHIIDFIHFNARASHLLTPLPFCCIPVELDQNEDQPGNGCYVYRHDLSDVGPLPTQ